MIPDNKAHGAYMGPTWGRQDPGGSHVGPMNLAIRDAMGIMLVYYSWLNFITDIWLLFYV